jgi:hypothetical protein
MKPLTIVAAVTLASALAGVSIAPAYARNDHDRRGHSDRGLHRGEWRNDRWAYRDPYYYSQPVYVPPPVYYPPQPSPGISLFFPLNLRGR